MRLPQHYFFVKQCVSIHRSISSTFVQNNNSSVIGYNGKGQKAFLGDKLDQWLADVLPFWCTFASTANAQLAAAYVNYDGSQAIDIATLAKLRGDCATLSKSVTTIVKNRTLVEMIDKAAEMGITFYKQGNTTLEIGRNPRHLATALNQTLQENLRNSSNSLLEDAEQFKHNLSRLYQILYAPTDGPTADQWKEELYFGAIQDLFQNGEFDRSDMLSVEDNNPMGQPYSVAYFAGRNQISDGVLKGCGFSITKQKTSEKQGYTIYPVESFYVRVSRNSRFYDRIKRLLKTLSDLESPSSIKATVASSLDVAAALLGRDNSQQHATFIQQLSWMATQLRTGGEGLITLCYHLYSLHLSDSHIDWSSSLFDSNHGVAACTTLLQPHLASSSARAAGLCCST